MWSHSTDWHTYKRGFAWTRDGAEAKAKRACFFELGVSHREIVIADEYPTPARPEALDPIPARHLGDVA